MKTELHTTGNHRVTGIEVLIAYDSVCSGKRAKELCDRLQTRLGPEYQLNLRLWSLAALQRDSLALAALADAASADLPFVAAAGDKPLPAPIRSWFSRCACRIHGGGALILQIHGIFKMEEELSSAYQLLKQVARGAGLGFFSEVVGPAEDQLDYSIESIHRHAQMSSPVFDAILQLP